MKYRSIQGVDKNFEVHAILIWEIKLDWLL